jgi:hypothetical protein
MEKVGTVFRGHPELEPTGKLSLLGEECCSAERMRAYVSRRNPNAPDVAELYLKWGNRYGIRGDVAYCQVVYETRGWTKAISGPYWWPITLAQWTEEATIEAHMQTLYSLASDLPLPETLVKAKIQTALIERSGWQGSVHCWEDLNGKWAGPGYHRYGQDIVSLWRSMTEWKGEGEVDMNRSSGEEQDRGQSDTARGRNRGPKGSTYGVEQMKWLQEQQLLPFPAPQPDRNVTWAELAALLHSWDNRSSIAAFEEKKISS